MRRSEATVRTLDLPRPSDAPAVAMTGGPAELAHALRCAMAADRIGDGTQAGAEGQGSEGRGAAGMELAASVLWSRFLRFDVDDPRWADRDRFVLSSGRFQPMLRALLRLTGHGEVPAGCAFGWHPAVETADGPPGQGFATAVGLAMAERALAGRYGRTLVDHRTWVLACENDLAAGVSLEAAALAGQMRLDKLVVLAGGPSGGDPSRTAGQASGDGGAGPDAMTRFAASGWAVRRVDAGDADAIALALAGALRVRRPTLITCHDVPPRCEVAVADGEAQAAWLAVGRRGAVTRRGWLRRLVRHRQQAEFERTRSGRLTPGWEEGWAQGWRDDADGGRVPADAAATLDAGRRGLAMLCGLLPELTTLHSTAGAPLLAGLADGATDPQDRTGRHWPCGVQEHGMAALANGLSLHGGLRPVLAAAFVSIDRMRPALRLGALMGQPVIYLLAGNGPDAADGAGWQPVEQLASLRAMPEVMVFRPAGVAEVEACWELALRHDHGPSLMALSAQPPTRRAAVADGCRRAAARAGCARGGYVREAAGSIAQATLIATGDEVAVALQARAALEAQGISVAVVSLPCWELFAAQPSSYREAILGKALRIGIEAACGFGWERWLGPDGIFIGMDGFGAAASAGTLHRQSGITPDAVAARVRRRLSLPAG